MINLSPNAKTVLEKRYLKDGETAEQLFKRVADNIAKAERNFTKDKNVEKEWAKEFYEIMSSLKFLPNSPTLMNAGKDLQQLSACFVLPVEDSLDKIFESVKHTALIHKSGGGTGFSFSRLRPKDDTVKTTKGVSSGPVSFMSVFDAATETIKQGGMRRGANMGILRVDHPDIMDFIYAKKDKTKLTNFNLSVAVTDEFMEAVKNDKEYNLIHPNTKEVVKTLKAKEVFNEMTKLAWEGGDPGIIFIDKINKDNPTPHIADIESTNPCWTGDTLVSTVEGAKSFKELAEIGEIDVYCMDTETKKVCVRTMRNIHKTGENKPIMRITVDKGQGKLEQYTLTHNHNLYIFDKNNKPVKVEAKDLKVDQELVSYTNLKFLYEQDLAYNHKIVNIELDYGTEDVYNGTVDEFHNYFVCDKEAHTDHVVTGFLSANCGEQPLLPYESCNLGSINLAKFVKNKRIDWDDLKTVINTAVRFLDNVIEMNNYPIPEIDKMTRQTRKIGLGVMGWADMLVQLEIPYNSHEAILQAYEVMKFIKNYAYEASETLGTLRGSFPAIKGSQFSSDRRNATVTTIAPTGTISIIADASSGIEPYFALAYYRNVMDGTKLPEVNPYLTKALAKKGLYTDELIDKIITKGSIQDIDEIPADIKKVFVTSHDINYRQHIEMQAVFQGHTDNAVSKTINLSHDATVDVVADAYMLSYDLDCKGITVYRDGSRQDQVLNIGKEEKKPEHLIHSIDKTAITDRPVVVTGKTIAMKTGCGKMYVTVNQDQEGKVFEVFTNIGKAGGCATSQCEAIGRLMSLSLKSGVKPEHLIKQLKGISCHMKIGFGPNTILSCSDAIGKALEQVIGMKEPIKVKVNHSGACPECNASLQQVEGCATCISCGYSRCS